MKSIIENIRVILIVLVLSCALFFGVSALIPKSEGKKSVFATKIIGLNDGYGYQIVRDDKILIQQEVIPAIDGKQAFKTSKDAQFVADLVLLKLMKGDSPVLTVQEIRELNVVGLAKN